MSLPQPVKYTITEGGDWFRWGSQKPPHRLIHSILFDDGSIFDAVTGWRPWKSCVQCGRKCD
jgi:hypothetical protein